MENFTLTIKMGNDAMKTPDDVARALEKVARRLRFYDTDGVIHDDNGNKVGTWSL